MSLERFQSPPPGWHAGASRALAGAMLLAAVVLAAGLAGAAPARAGEADDGVAEAESGRAGANPDSDVAVEEGASGDTETEAAAEAVGLSTAGDGDGDGDGEADEDGEGDDREDRASVSGSVTTRYQATEGTGNDRASGRLSLEWSAGAWTGAFTAQVESTRLDGALHHEPGVGSFDLPERWVGWRHEGERNAVDLRLGSSYGLRFGEGLVLGAATFDGVQLGLELGEAFDLFVLAGRTEALSPEDFLFEPLTLFPIDDEEELGSDGELAGVRAVMRPRRDLSVGVNLVRAASDGLPHASLGSVDVAFGRGIVDVVGEVAVREGGGHALYARTDIAVSDEVVVGVERRDYRGFGSPLGSAPLYGGISAGDERDEDGWRLSVDFAPTRRFSGRWSFDYSKGGDKDGTLPRVRRDHVLELDFVLGERTALSYGFELEDVSGGDDGRIHSLLLTHAFEGGARLSGRLSLDRSTPGWRETLRTSYRVPLLKRRLTLLVDDTLRAEGGSVQHSLTAGFSLRITRSSFITVRATAEAGDADSVDLTWYRRF